MKETLEYKILKYLSENDNGEYFDVSFIESNCKLLNSKINELKKVKYIEETRTPVITDSHISSKDPLYKILLNGTNRLNEIERTIVTNNIEELTLKKLKFEQFPAKFWWLILIIAGVISILTTWVNNQISKSENQQEQPKKEIVLQK
jgi:hypothetical protein